MLSFKIYLRCPECRKTREFAVRAVLNCVVEVKVNFACQTCGFHGSKFLDKQTMQDWFINRIGVGSEENKTPPNAKKQRRKKQTKKLIDIKNRKAYMLAQALCKSYIRRGNYSA